MLGFISKKELSKKLDVSEATLKSILGLARGDKTEDPKHNLQVIKSLVEIYFQAN